jgi:hypothetical protein
VKKNKLGSIAAAIAMVASLTSVSAAPVAAEGQNQVSAHIDWSGVNLTTNTAMSQTIKPISVPPISAGQADWAIHMGNTEQALWPSFILSNSGRATFAFFDVPAGSKVENVGNSSCNVQAGNAFQAANTWRSTCSAPLMPKAGETYEFVMKPLKINGSQWWAGFVTIQSTGEVLPLGRLENNPSTAVINGSQSMYGYNQISFWKQNLPPCSQIPDFSAVIGPLLTTTGNKPIVSGTRISQTCPGISSVDTSSGPRFYQVNIGNTSPSSGSSSSTTSDIIPGAMSGSYFGPDIKPSRGGMPITRICPNGKVVTQISVALQMANSITPGFNFGCSQLSADGEVGEDVEIYDIVRQVFRESDYTTAKCKPGSAVVAINASTVNYVKDLTITCGTVNPFSIGPTPMIGVGSKLPINAYSKCTESNSKPAFITGFSAYAAAGLDTVQSICTPFSSFLKAGGSNSNNSGSVKTDTPSFSTVSFAGSTINITVNIGSGIRPDQIYLESEELGLSGAKRVLGKISGSVATWRVNFSSLLTGKSIPLKLISVKNGIESNVVEEIFSIPGAIKNAISGSAPVAPKNVTTRIIGTSGIVTAIATIKSGSLAQDAYLFGSSLGISSTNPIKGEILATKVIFEIPIKTSMAGKTFPFTVYFENDAGKSAPTAGKISVPALPKIKIEAPKIPTPKGASSTVFCLKGSISRTFAAKTCPPGWKKN